MSVFALAFVIIVFLLYFIIVKGPGLEISTGKIILSIKYDHSEAENINVLEITNQTNSTGIEGNLSIEGNNSFKEPEINWVMELDDEYNKKLKMAVISGAAHALEYKEKNPRLMTQEVMQHVTDEAEKILEKIDEEL